MFRKPYIRSLNGYGFKTRDFSAIDIIKTKQMFFSRVSEVPAVKAQPSSGKGGGGQQLICI